MELILWRHAESEKPEGNLPDHKRKLTVNGRKQAAAMAAWLKPRLPKKTHIVVCPSVRARETADFLELPYDVDRKIGIGADPAELLAAAKWPEGGDPVLLVCHQPGIGRLASLFIGGAESEMPIKKCGVFWFSTREREHRLQVVLRAVMYPDLV
jgi:phosphohistidine phosphatase